MKYMKRLFLRLFFCIEIFVFAFVYFFGTNGVQAMKRITSEDAGIIHEVQDLKKEIALLEQELMLWRMNPFYKEKVAREQLQMAKKGETIYYLS